MYPGYDPLYFAVIHKRERVLNSARTPAQKQCAQRYAELANAWLERREADQQRRGPLSRLLGIFGNKKYNSTK